MFGLTKEVMLKMLKKNIPDNDFEAYYTLIREKLIPNIVEVIAANYKAILFKLQKDRTSKFDSE